MDEHDEGCPVPSQPDRYSNAATVKELSFLARQVSDRTHGARGFVKPGVPPLAIVPPGANVVAPFDRQNGADLLAEASDYVMFVESWASETVVTVAAASHERANSDQSREFVRSLASH
jgi:hypothetical protein